MRYKRFYAQVFGAFCLFGLFLGCLSQKPAATASGSARPGANQTALIPPNAVAQFIPHHRCTNCPPHLPQTNIVVSWSYGSNLVNGFNQAYFADLRRVETNYLQVYYCTAPGGPWVLWTNTTSSPVILPCTNALGFYGFQLAWL